VREGLARVRADTPVRRSWLELQVGATQAAGAWARGELGTRPWEHVTGFLFAQASSRAGWSAGAGGRWDF
jgi:hypothetical protein